ncbi:MAG: outer membrane beta-barrel protein [candidate division KSB1 bacterium]|nr:outer membrane beta-barrel protein [candidate division KSB1 bacterium]
MKRMAFAVVMLMITLPVMGQADIGLYGVGGQLGFVMPEDPIDNAISFGANADLGTIMPDLHLGASVDFWKKSYDVGFGSGSDASFSVLSIAALARYTIDIQQTFTPYVGGGLGLVIGTSSFEYTEPFSGKKVDESESDTELGIHLLSGARMPVTPDLDGFAELRYTLGDIDYFSILAGVSYSLK